MGEKSQVVRQSGNESKKVRRKSNNNRNRNEMKVKKKKWGKVAMLKEKVRTLKERRVEGKVKDE